MIEEDLDADLERLAVKQSTSKAALIRRFVREAVVPLPPLEEDPITKMIGTSDAQPAPVDDVVYPR
jgi:hypothetical protein